MKRTVVLLMALLFSASWAMAGEVYGTIMQGSKPVAVGVKLEISVAGKVYSTETDKFGSYRVIVKEKGKGTITVTIDTTSVSAGMFSYDKATRYDWVLDTKDGELFLRRK